MLLNVYSKNKLFLYFFKPLVLTTLAFLINSNSIIAQTYYFDNYSVKDGLAQSNIYSIVQGSDGTLWLGTASGVSRFDGKVFKNYTTEDGLAENGVRTVFLDSKNNIWFGHTGGGISRYYENKFENVLLKGINLNHDITSIIEDSKGHLWISTVGSGAIRLLNPSEKSISSIKYEQFKGNEGLSDAIFSIYQTKDNTIYFITDVGIKLFDEEKISFEFYQLKGIPRYFQVTTMHEDRNGNMWLGTHNGGLYKFDKKRKIYDVKDGLSSNFISTITDDSHDNIWIGTWGGGVTKISKNGKLKIFDAKNGLKDNKIRCIIEDREGNIIFGTNENGLFIFKGTQFVSFTEDDGLINSQVWSILQDKSGKYWFATNAGISTYEIKSGSDSQAEEYPFKSARKIHDFNYFNNKNSGLNSDHIRVLKEDSNGYIWIGTADDGVYEYDPNRSVFKYNPIINRLFPRSNYLVTAMEIDNENNLWVGTTEGLIYYEIDNIKYNFLTQGSGLAGNDISAIYCDSRGRIWIGSRGKGLASIKGTIITIEDLGDHLTPLTIVEDNDNNIWIGTESHGVIVYNGNEIINNLRTRDGLLSDHITSLNVDSKNNIYIGTSAGLMKYDLEEKKIYKYTIRSGFTGIEVKNNSSFRDKDGNIWFGTVNGAIKFDLAAEHHNTLEPLTQITRLRVNLNDRDMLDGLKLDYREKSITFDYNSICLTDPEEVRYKVMLEGADEDWRPVSTQTYVTYSPLPPGSYVFKVIAANNEGVWNNEPVTYSFRIKPPFWQTWWFYLIVAVVIVSVIIIYIQYRERKLKRDKKILEDKVVERTAEVVRQKEEIELEKDKSERLLLNTLPAKVVQDLKDKGKTEPEGFDNVSIFFSDIVNFTSISSTLDPKILIGELSDMFTAFDDIMTNNQCERIKTIGDAYMAVCGMPQKNNKHAEKMVMAAMEIRDYMLAPKKNSKLNWQIRIGIHSGRVVGGIVGVRKYQYDVFGDTINTASRMESNGEPMKINISEQTYNLLKGKFKFTKRGTYEIKGKGEMRMFFVDKK